MGYSHRLVRIRWAALGAAFAVALGAGGWGVARATVSSGDRPVFVSVDGERILDTRIDVGLPGPFADAVPRDVQVTGSVAVTPSGSKTVVPVGATAVVMTVTVDAPSAGGFVSVRPKGASGFPATSNVNFSAGQTIANAVTVDLPADGGIQVWFDTWPNGGTGDVLIDIVGYYAAHDHDDRYADREVTTSISPWGLALTDPDDGIGAPQGCPTKTEGTAGFGSLVLPIDLPIGAEVHSVLVKMYRGNQGAVGYSITLQRATLGADGNTITNLVTGDGQGDFGPPVIDTHELIATSELVEVGESFSLLFSPGAVSKNGLCTVEVSYTLPAA